MPMLSLTEVIRQLTVQIISAEETVASSQRSLDQARAQVAVAEASVKEAVDRRDGLRDAVRLMELEQAQRAAGRTLIPAKGPALPIRATAG